MAKNSDLHMVSSVIFMVFGFSLLEIGMLLYFDPDNAGVITMLSGILLIAINAYYFYLLKYNYIIVTQ
jgi:hypothetical protein